MSRRNSFGEVYRAPAGASDIAPGAVDTTALADHAVTTVKHGLLSVTPTELATDAVTNAKIAPNALDNETVLWGTPGGQRITVDSTGIVYFYTGVGGETPGTITGTASPPGLRLVSGIAGTNTEQAFVTMSSGPAGTSVAGLAASSVALLGNGTGAGMDTFQVASSGLVSPTSTTNITIPSLSQAVTVGSTSEVYFVTINADWEVVGGTTSVIELLIGGSAQTPIMTKAVNGIASSFSDRAPEQFTWRITGLTPGVRTFTARTRNTAASTFANVYGSSTTMLIERKA